MEEKTKKNKGGFASLALTSKTKYQHEVGEARKSHCLTRCLLVEGTEKLRCCSFRKQLLSIRTAVRDARLRCLWSFESEPLINMFHKDIWNKHRRSEQHRTNSRGQTYLCCLGGELGRDLCLRAAVSLFPHLLLPLLKIASNQAGGLGVAVLASYTCSAAIRFVSMCRRLRVATRGGETVPRDASLTQAKVTT